MNTCPNILLCIADDAGKHQGAYGCPWVSTPAFDRIAREGLLFHNAVTPNAKCAPSRAAILTGRNSWQLKDAATHCNIWPLEFMSFMEVLDQAGYRIGHTNKGWAPGTAEQADGSPRLLTGPAWNERTTSPPTSCMSKNDYPANFRDFLDQTSSEQPFCFWFGAKEPHRDYEFGTGAGLGRRRPQEIDRVPGIWPDNETVRHDLLDYGFELEYFDRQVGAMLDLLEERGLLDNTLVIVTSDNGMPFPRVKGQEYNYSNNMPLAVMWPKGIRQPGRQVDDHVSFIDIAPTCLELAGVDATALGMPAMTGKSWSNLFASEVSGRIDPERSFALIGKERHDPGRPQNQGYPIRGIFSGGWLYLRNYETSRWPAGNPETGYMNCDKSPTKTEVLKARRDPATRHFWRLCFGKRPSEELYHLAEDPDCLRNLADDPAWAERRDQMRDTMESALRSQGDPRMFGQGDIFDTYPFSHPWLQDFYERFEKRHITGECMEPGWIAPADLEWVDDDGNPREPRF